MFRVSELISAGIFADECEVLDALPIELLDEFAPRGHRAPWLVSGVTTKSEKEGRQWPTEWPTLDKQEGES